MDNFVAFILTHGRADSVITDKSLKRHGYTGRIIYVIDDEDEQADRYFAKYKNDVVQFNKKKIAETFDECDNFNDRRSIVYARNACFEIAQKLKIRYFIQLDDDYTSFEYRLYSTENQKPKKIKNLDSVFGVYLNFLKETRFNTIALAQGGDFIGGKHNSYAGKPTLFRKAMNSFICDSERPFKFIGRINEDVNTYVSEGRKGVLMGTIPFASLTQKTTQKNKGGMTELYLDSGTYVKSFYTVMLAPSCTTIAAMGDKHLRLHHSVEWDYGVPKIVKYE